MWCLSFGFVNTLSQCRKVGFQVFSPAMNLHQWHSIKRYRHFIFDLLSEKTTKPVAEPPPFWLKRTRMPILMRWDHPPLSVQDSWLNALFHKTFGWEGFGKPRDHILVEGKSVLSASVYAYLLAFAYAEMLLWITYLYIARRKSKKGSGFNRSCNKNY